MIPTLNIDKSNWKKYRFDEVCRQVNESSKNPAEDGLVHVIGLEHIEPNNLHITQWDTLEKETTFTRKFVKGQVLFGRRRAYQRKTALATQDGICSAHAMVLRAKENIVDSRFFPFLFHSKQFIDMAITISVGGLSPTINWKDIAKQEFLLPPLAEQQRLAELLWAADEMIEKEKRELEGVERMFEAELKNTFDNNTKKTLLEAIANITMGQSPDGASYNEDCNGMLFLQGNAEFTDKYPKAYKYTSAPNRIANKGDVLMSVRAPVGAINIADQQYCIGRGLCAISMKDGDNDYLRFLLYSLIGEMEKQSTGSTFKAINGDVIKKLPVPSDKQDISLLLSSEKIINDFKNQITKSQEVKQEIVNKIF